MNRTIISLALIILLFAACKKSNNNDIHLNSDIMVVNTAIGVPSIKVNASTANNFTYLKATMVNYGIGTFYYVPRTNFNVKVVATSDTTTFLVNNTFKFNQILYTLYIAGQAPVYDTLFRAETNFPIIKTDVTIPPSADSVVNIRFVNLSPNSVPVKIVKITPVYPPVTPSQNVTTTEVDNLVYKGISNWKPCDARITGTMTSRAYTFQVQDASTSAVLATFSFTASSTNRFKNVALVIKGLQGTTSGTNAFGLFAVNYF